MPSAIITVMSNAAIKAGKILLRDYGEVDELQVSRKGTSNFVTKTDMRVEKMLHIELSKARPEYGFLMEEGGEIPGEDSTHRWIIDPLDGTSNFIHALPYFCISIALERTIKGVSEVIAGIVYDPMHNEVFSAEKGRGAMINDRRRISVSGRESLEESMIVTGNPRWAPNREEAYAMFKSVVGSEAAVRHSGASALDLAYVACGRYDACWFNTIKPWDIAAGILLVQEAGGVVTQIDGKPASVNADTLLATNKPLQEKVMKLLAG